MMTAAAERSDLPEALRDEMARLHACGFALIPLDGKRPLVRAWTGARLSLSQVLGPMYRARSRVYGIRLDDLAVLDCDTRDAALVDRLERRFGPAAVRTTTPRGMHLWYARPSGPFPNLRAESLPVDLKSGPRSYVVGPGSLRTDGGHYLAERGVLGDPLGPLLVAPQAMKIPEGKRHTRLVTLAMGMVEYVDSAGELTANLFTLRNDTFENPDTMPDREVKKVSEWAWGRRLANSVYRDRHSAFRFPRVALDRLRTVPNASDAIALYAVLSDLHGHVPGKRFALVWGGMRKAGLTDLSERKFRAARNALLGAGLLRRAGNHCARNQHQTFQLCLPHDPGTGGGSYNYICRADSTEQP